MKLIEGVVEAISAKELPNGEDQWGNTCRVNIKVGEDWIGLGTSKKPEVNIKEGAGWHKLAKGDTIAVVVEENGQWLNAKKSDIKIKGKGNSPTTGGASQARTSGGSAASRTGPTASAPVDWARKDAGAAASASIDKALVYLSATNQFGSKASENFDLIYEVAREMQGLVKTLAAEILNPPQALGDSDGGKPEGSPGPKPPLTNGLSKARGGKPKPVEPDPEDFNDDDIPF